MRRCVWLCALTLWGVSAHANVAGVKTRLSTATTTPLPLEEQNAPAISGTDVVWTDFLTPVGGNTSSDIFLRDLVTGSTVNLTNTPGEQEFLEDIDAGNVVWTRTTVDRPGDIVLYNVATAVEQTVAQSSSVLHFEQPAIRGRYVTFLRDDDLRNQIDVDLFDNLTGLPAGPVTTDSAVQGRPRVGADTVVYEDWSKGSADPDIFGWTISTRQTFPIAATTAAEITPDIDGNTVVYAVTIAPGNDQIFAYNLTTGQATQLTTVASNKVLPRISGNRIVWSDDRNATSGQDLYLYDLSTHTEQPLVTDGGNQFLSDLDGNRVVYTSDEDGLQEVFLFTITEAPPPPPPSLPWGCDPAHTVALGSTTTMTHSSWRPEFAGGSFASQAGKTYWACVENGLTDGSERAHEFIMFVDGRIVINPALFNPPKNPPHYVAVKLPLGGHHGDCDDRHGFGHSGGGQNGWFAGLFGHPTTTVKVTIRVEK